MEEFLDEKASVGIPVDVEEGTDKPSSSDYDMDEKNTRATLRQDPFASREGKTLTWRNVNMTAKLKGRKGAKELLTDSWGEVPKSEVTAIMGPSGAGKTSLLNILSGRAQSRGNIVISSDIRLNNYQVDPTNIEVRKQIAFVAQDDSLQTTATPREAIKFSAKMRLPRVTTDAEIDILASRMLEELGLEHCADTIIGGQLVKGISGGERKRTSVGVELVVKPALVFLDEPTSGLDSFSAVQLVQVLKKVSSAGSSVLFTIHQPSSEVFSSFDHLILLNRGRVMYQGAVADVPPFFSDHGQPVPANYNPADWIMAVAQSVPEDELSEAGFFPSDERQMEKALDPRNDRGRDLMGLSRRASSLANFGSFNGRNVRDKRHISFCTEVKLLFVRELLNARRNKKAMGARFALTTFMSLLVGVIFFGVGGKNPLDPVNFNGHFGALIMILMMSMFGTAMPSLLSFPEERPVFIREYSTNHYSVASYFISRLCTEALVTAIQILISTIISYHLVDLQMNFFHLYATAYTLGMSSTALAVMLGCAVEDPKMATEFLPLLFVPQMLFAGFFVATHLIPVWLRWAQYLCALTYAVRIVILAEFSDCAEARTPLPGKANMCKLTITNNQADEDDVWWYWLLLCMLFVVFRLLALFILKKKASKFL